MKRTSSITTRTNSPISTNRLSGTNHIRSLAARGISIGVPRTASLGGIYSFPHLEIEVRRESLPNEQVVRFIAEHSNAAPLLWHVTIDSLHESKSFTLSDFQLFVRMLEECGPACHMLMLAFDRTAEYDARVLDHIEAFRDSVTSFPVLLDTEHPSWKSNRNQAIFKSLKLPHVFLDIPNLPGIIKDATYDTGHTAVLRCLGRNSRTWFEPKVEERFHYAYTEEELCAISLRIKELKEFHDRVFVTFCNRPSAIAIQNAIHLSQLLP